MTAWPTFWNHVLEGDRALLRTCVNELLKHGAIIGDDGAARELYMVARDQYFRELSDYFAVLSIDLAQDSDRPIIQARPIAGECDLLSTFTKDETLVVLSLWRIYDEIRSERPTAAVVISVNDLWQKLKLFFERIEPPTESQLDRILGKLRRKRLVKFQRSQEELEFGESLIEILPTLARAIPFENIEAWSQQTALYNEPAEIGDSGK